MSRIALLFVVVSASALAEPVPALPAALVGLEARHDVVERWARALGDLHPLDPRALASLDEEGLRALCVLARDRGQKVALRARAVALLPARPSALVDAVLQEARRDPEREVRLAAAWAQGLLLRGQPGSLGFVRGLLDDAEPHMRETGVHLLFRLHPEEAPAIAAAHLATEQDPALRALVERRLRHL